jgi:polyisoprenoid-binding protein YceI
MIFLSATAFRRFASVAAAAAGVVLGSAAFAADIYVFDKGHTEIRFSWSHFGISRMSGMMLDFDGALNFDAAAPENSKLRFTGKTNSVWTHVKELDNHLQGADFFDARKYPEISFMTTKVEKTGDKTGKITGDLTIKGVTKPVTLDAELKFNGPHPYDKKPVLGFEARTTIKRSDFKVDGGIPFVSDEIEITINTEMNQRS